MENELEMIQTLFEYQSFGLIAFPCSPFSKDIHNSTEGRLLYHKAVQGIKMSDEEIYKWFGEKKLDNCGLILGEKGNLSVMEFENDAVIQKFHKSINSFEESLKKINKLEIKQMKLKCSLIETSDLIDNGEKIINTLEY